jgi:hypothetical protein
MSASSIFLQTQPFCVCNNVAAHKSVSRDVGEEDHTSLLNLLATEHFVPNSAHAYPASGTCQLGTIPTQSMHCRNTCIL